MTAVAGQRLPIVVIVEDDGDLGELYAGWLADSYRVRTVQSADEAKAIIDKDIDVVILDRLLPGPSGDELLAWIHSQQLRARVAMVSGVTPDFDVIEMGFDTYIQKPTSRREIREVVQMLLTRTMYDQRVQRYFELRTKKRLLEGEKNSVVLEENQHYRQLSAELREIRAELDYLLRNLDEEYFAAEMGTLVGK